MKSLIILTTLAASLTAFAAELPVMEVQSAQIRRGASLSTRFEVNLQDGTAGVSLTATKMVHRGRTSHMTSKTFEKLVPELALVNDKLMLGEVECGTMGETRVFRRPVLNLSGKCDVVAKKEGSVVKVSIVTE